MSAFIHSSSISLQRFREPVAEPVIQLGRKFLLHIRHGVLVDVAQHVGGGMAHALHSVFVWNTFCQHDGSLVMAQVMKTELKACLGTNALETTGDGIRRQVDGVLAFLIWQCQKAFHDILTNKDGAFRERGFWEV